METRHRGARTEPRYDFAGVMVGFVRAGFEGGGSEPEPFAICSY